MLRFQRKKRYKLKETCDKFIFLGYSFMLKGYKLYNLKTRKVLVSKDMLFGEK
jgi:hypothetical protein